MSYKQQVKQAARDHLLTLNYYLNHYKEVIWLIGDGRSGTTWVADLINHNKQFREMFEPFHPTLVDDMAFMEPHYYMQPGSSDVQLEAQAAAVFSGRLKHARVDEANWSYFYQGLLVKDIFANLFAFWAVKKFPSIKPVLLLRNPFAVALSKYKKRHWYWMTDPLAFLRQETLVNDYLQPYVDIIHTTSEKQDYILSQIIIWCVVNTVPLKQFKKDALHTVFYEDAFLQPQKEIDAIFDFVGGQHKSITIDSQVVAKPSRVVSNASHFNSQSLRLDSWCDELTRTQIDEGLFILDAFGLAELYDEKSLPNKAQLQQWQEKN